MSHILIVDDETDTCRVMSRLFARRGWTSDCVNASAEAMAAIRANPPVAVLLDVLMPGMDGFAILAALRADEDPAVASVPVLFYSALHDRATADRAMDAGADDYIPKLTSAREVADRVGLFMSGPGVDFATATSPQNADVAVLAAVVLVTEVEACERAMTLAASA
jgi:two-component system sensor histidine kinase/response regulator